MGVWIKHSEDTLIPMWLKTNLTDSCMHCGSPMLNYYNDDNRCTNRKCSNSKCYGFLAAKADVMRQIVGIEGIGYESCLKDAMMIKATSQFQLLRLWGSKPTVSLVEYLKMHCFEGIDTEWERIVIEGGYLDIGINDTMKDLVVNFIGAVTFSLIGFLYIENREKYKFSVNFIPRRKRESGGTNE